MILWYFLIFPGYNRANTEMGISGLVPEITDLNPRNRWSIYPWTLIYSCVIYKYPLDHHRNQRHLLQRPWIPASLGPGYNLVSSLAWTYLFPHTCAITYVCISISIQINSNLHATIIWFFQFSIISSYIIMDFVTTSPRSHSIPRSAAFFTKSFLVRGMATVHSPTGYSGSVVKTKI